MKKFCPGCNMERDGEKDFAWKDKVKGLRQRWCRECQREANKVHYQNNKQVYLQRAITRNTRVNDENKQKLYHHLSSHPCVDCGQTDVRLLEFDHVRGEKVADIARLVAHAASWKVIETELAKCEVRCANCHRLKTSAHGRFWRNLATF